MYGVCHNSLFSWEGLLKKNIQSLNFPAGWRDLCPKFRNRVEKIARVRDSRPEKFSVFRKFLLLRNETPRFRKIRRFSCNNEHFLSVRGNFLLEVIVFRFYQELNAVRSQNSELSWGKSHVFLIFGEIIVYLRKAIVDLKNNNCGKSSYSGN